MKPSPLPSSIDLSDTQLCDTEAAEYVEYSRERDAKEAEAERKRWEKIRSFRFKGGTC